MTGCDVLYSLLTCNAKRAFGDLNQTDKILLCLVIVMMLSVNVIYLVYNVQTFQHAHAHPVYSIAYADPKTTPFVPFGVLICQQAALGGNAAYKLGSALFSYFANRTTFFQISALRVKNDTQSQSEILTLEQSCGRAGTCGLYRIEPQLFLCPRDSPLCPPVGPGGQASQYATCLDVPYHNASFTGALGQRAGNLDAINTLLMPDSIAISSLTYHLEYANGSAVTEQVHGSGFENSFFLPYEASKPPVSAFTNMQESLIVSGYKKVVTLGVSAQKFKYMQSSLDTARFSLSQRYSALTSSITQTNTAILTPSVSIDFRTSTATETVGYGWIQLTSAIMALGNAALAVIAFLFPTVQKVRRQALWRGPTQSSSQGLLSRTITKFGGEDDAARAPAMSMSLSHANPGFESELTTQSTRSPRASAASAVSDSTAD